MQRLQRALCASSTSVRSAATWSPLSGALWRAACEGNSMHCSNLERASVRRSAHTQARLSRAHSPGAWVHTRDALVQLAQRRQQAL